MADECDVSACRELSDSYLEGDACGKPHNAAEAKILHDWPPQLNHALCTWCWSLFGLPSEAQKGMCGLCTAGTQYYDVNKPLQHAKCLEPCKSGSVMSVWLLIPLMPLLCKLGPTDKTEDHRKIPQKLMSCKTRVIPRSHLHDHLHLPYRCRKPLGEAC